MEEECIIEFQQVGNSVKVTAIDPVTMREVSIVGSAKTPQPQLAKIAIQKLRYVQAKEADS